MLVSTGYFVYFVPNPDILLTTLNSVIYALYYPFATPGRLRCVIIWMQQVPYPFRIGHFHRHICSAFVDLYARRVPVPVLR